MHSPVFFQIDKNLVPYIEYGDSSIADYYDLPEDYLQQVDAEIAAIGAQHWGNYGEFHELGRCDITGELCEVVSATAFILIEGFKADSDARPAKVWRVQERLCTRYPDAVHETSPAGIVSITAGGACFTFYPKNASATRTDIRVTHAA